MYRITVDKVFDKLFDKLIDRGNERMIIERVKSFRQSKSFRRKNSGREYFS